MRQEAVDGRSLLNQNSRGRGLSLIIDAFGVMKQANHLQLDPIHVITAVLQDPSTYVEANKVLEAASVTLTDAAYALSHYAGRKCFSNSTTQVELYVKQLEEVFARLPEAYRQWEEAEYEGRRTNPEFYENRPWPSEDTWPGATTLTQFCLEADTATIHELNLRRRRS